MLVYGLMKLFSVFKSCIESVCDAIKMLHALKNGTKIDKGNIMPMGKYLSMKEILDPKDSLKEHCTLGKS